MMFGWFDTPEEQLKKRKRERSIEDMEAQREYETSPAEYEKEKKNLESTRRQEDLDLASEFYEDYPPLPAAPDELNPNTSDEEIANTKAARDFVGEIYGEKYLEDYERKPKEKKYQFSTPLSSTGRAGGTKEDKEKDKEKSISGNDFDAIVQRRMLRDLGGGGSFLTRDVDRINESRERKLENYGRFGESLMDMSRGFGTVLGPGPKSERPKLMDYNIPFEGKESKGIPKEVIDYLKTKHAGELSAKEFELKKKIDEGKLAVDEREIALKELYPGAQAGNLQRAEEFQYRKDQDINKEILAAAKEMVPRYSSVVSAFNTVDITLGSNVEDIKYENGDPVIIVDGKPEVAKFAKVWGATPKPLNAAARSILASFEIMKRSEIRALAGASQTEAEIQGIENQFQTGGFSSTKEMIDALVRYKMYLAINAEFSKTQYLSPEAMERYNTRGGIGLRSFGKTGQLADRYMKSNPDKFYWYTGNIQPQTQPQQMPQPRQNIETPRQPAPPRGVPTTLPQSTKSTQTNQTPAPTQPQGNRPYYLPKKPGITRLTHSGEVKDIPSSDKAAIKFWESKGWMEIP
jgi:hypothetical protein